MSFYMFTGRYTAAALKAMVDNPQDREPAGRALVEAAGGKLHNLFFMFGQDDIMALIEAPDDATMAAGVLALGASGAFAGGATTKLMTTKEAMKAMGGAQKALGAYKPPTG
jgi:uncharacterized protein with GYD domain